MKRFMRKYAYDLALLPIGIVGYILGAFGTMFTQNSGICIVAGCVGALVAQLVFVIRVPESVFQSTAPNTDDL